MFDKILSEIKEANPQSLVSQLEEFKTSRIWLDIRNELNSWRIDTWELLEVSETTDELLRLQGRAKCLRDTMAILDFMIESANISKEE